MTKVRNALFIVLGLALVLLILQCPRSLFGLGELIPDGYVFKYIAVRITEGEMPYLDIFDHKGPLIYLIDLLGVVIHKDYGLFIVEFIFAAVSAVFMYLIPRKIGCDSIKSSLIAIAAMAFYISVFEAGNFTEEFALPFILFSLWVFIDYFKNDKVTALRLILLGISFGAIMLLRPNMAGLWAVFCIAVIIKCVASKQIKKMFIYILEFLLGSVMIIAPVMLWLYAKGALNACYENYILFNLKYSDSDAVLRSIAMMDMISRPYIIATFIALAALLVLLSKYKLPIPKTVFAFALYFILQSVLFTMAGTSYDHYYITAVPFLIYPVSELAKILEDKGRNKAGYIITAAIALMFSYSFVFASINIYDYTVGKRRVPESVSELVDAVNNEKGEDDTLIMFGNWDYLYLATDMRSATRYTYTKPIIYLDHEIMVDYFNELNNNKPDILVLEFINDEIREFIKDNQYEVFYESKYYIALKRT